MKKSIAVIVAFAAIFQAANACSICGCSATGSYLGVLPQYQKHFIGLRYNYRSFETTHPYSIIPGLSGRKSAEKYQTVELTGRFVPAKRIQVLAVVPYQMLSRSINGTTNSSNGIGDVSAMGYYSILSGKNAASKKVSQLLQAGVGIKLPTGRYTKPANENEESPQFNPGTGSWDKMVSAIYTLRGKKWGWLTDATFTLNGENRDGYQFGNKVSGTSRLFYALKRCKGTWMFHGGMYAETARQDRQKGNAQAYTGGWIAMPGGGLDFFGNKWAAGFSYRHPGAQQLSDGYIKSNGRLLFNVSILFN